MISQSRLVEWALFAVSKPMRRAHEMTLVCFKFIFWARLQLQNKFRLQTGELSSWLPVLLK